MIRGPVEDSKEETLNLPALTPEKTEINSVEDLKAKLFQSTAKLMKRTEEVVEKKTAIKKKMALTIMEIMAKSTTKKVVEVPKEYAKSYFFGLLAALLFGAANFCLGETSKLGFNSIYV